MKRPNSSPDQPTQAQATRWRTRKGTALLMVGALLAGCSAQRLDGDPNANTSKPAGRTDCISTAHFKTPDGWDKVKVSPYGQTMMELTNKAARLSDAAAGALYQEAEKKGSLKLVKVCKGIASVGAIMTSLRLAGGIELRRDDKEAAITCGVLQANRGSVEGAVDDDIRKVYAEDKSRATGRCEARIASLLGDKHFDLQFPFPPSYSDPAIWETNLPAHAAALALLPAIARQFRPTPGALAA